MKIINKQKAVINLKNFKYDNIEVDLKKDQEIRNQIQLELLSNKFNKSDKSNPDDVDSLIIHFIKNYSINDAKKSHNDLWKRISKCIEALI